MQGSWPEHNFGLGWLKVACDLAHGSTTGYSHIRQGGTSFISSSLFFLFMDLISAYKPFAKTMDDEHAEFDFQKTDRQ